MLSCEEIHGCHSFRADLIQDLVRTIGSIRDLATRAHTEVIEVLGKQSEFHVENISNDREFRKIFKDYMKNKPINHSLLLLHQHRFYCILLCKLIGSLTLLLNNSLQINRCSVWCLKTNDSWWELIVTAMTDEQFKENFRLDRSTFRILLQHIESYFRKKNTNFHPCISVEKKVCCALYALGSTAELRTIANLFGIGKSTARQLLQHFCSILVDIFFSRLVRFPTTNDEIKKTIDGFAQKYSYPLCLGALDGTHISVTPPKGFETDYLNFKKFYSVIMLAVVDAEFRFTYINVGAPGRSNLADVIKSVIYQDYSMMVMQQ